MEYLTMTLVYTVVILWLWMAANWVARATNRQWEFSGRALIIALMLTAFFLLTMAAISPPSDKKPASKCGIVAELMMLGG